MKIYSIIGILLFLSISIQLTAQSKPSLTESDIEGQFKYLISRADDYDDSKIVKRWILYTFKSHVMDTLDYLKKEIVVKDSLQQITVDEVAELKVKLEELEKNLKTVSKERDSLSLFGASMNKTAFYSIIIFIIIALTGVIVVFVVLYNVVMC